MSTASYKRKPYTVRWVYYTYHDGVRLHAGKSLRYAQTDEEAMEEAKKSLIPALYPSFMIWRIETEYH